MNLVRSRMPACLFSSGDLVLWVHRRGWAAKLAQNYLQVGSVANGADAKIDILFTDPSDWL